MEFLGQRIKNVPALQKTKETWVQSLGREDPLKQEMATHSGMLACKIPLHRGAWWATVQGGAESRTGLSD